MRASAAVLRHPAAIAPHRQGRLTSPRRGGKSPRPPLRPRGCRRYTVRGVAGSIHGNHDGALPPPTLAARLLASPAVPLAFATAVYAPLLHNYFYLDDFFELYGVVNEPLLPFLLKPMSGHLLVVRNAVLALCYHVFGMDPRGYFALVLATHLFNVWLLFKVIRTLTGSAKLACLGSTLWGSTPVQEGTLGWYAVYGHVLATTALLLLLADLGRLSVRGRAPSWGRLALWYAVLLAGTNCFGTAIAAALAFPLVAALLVPPVAGRGRAAVLATLWVTVPALWLLQYRVAARYGAVDALQMPLLLAFAKSWRADALMAARLFPHGLVALATGFLVPRWQENGIVVTGVVALYAAAATLALLWGTAADRRIFLASFLLASAVYAMIVLGRAGIYQAFGLDRSLLQMTPRYHYEASAALAISICAIFRAVGRRWLLPSTVRSGLTIAWLLALALTFALSGWHMDHHDQSRKDTAAALASIRQAVATQPPSSLVLISNRRLPIAGMMPPEASFPGLAAVFALFFPGDRLDGRTVRFLESDAEAVRAARRGLRSRRLILPAPPAKPRPP